MRKLRVGVIRDSQSIQSGGYVLRHLDTERYTAVDVFVDRTYTWHIQGVSINPQTLSWHVDVCVVVSSDRAITRVVQSTHVPCVGISGLTSVRALHAHHRNMLLSQGGIKTLPYYIIEKNDVVDVQIHEAFTKLPLPLSVEAHDETASVSESGKICKTFSEFQQVVYTLLETNNAVLVESMFAGTCGHVHMMQHFRQTPLYTLFLQDTDKPLHTPTERSAIQAHAQKAYNLLGLEGCVSMQYVLTPKYCYIKRVDPHPLLSEESLLQKSFETTGITHKEFVDYLVQQAQK